MCAAYVLLLFCLSLARTAQAECQRPQGGENMRLKSPTTFPAPEGSQATFECETGYRQVGGPAAIVCSQGQWTSLKMKCEIRQCGSAEDVLNGYVQYTGTEFGDTAKTVCNSGFSLDGRQNSVYCGLQGWTGRLAQCEPAICDAPDTVVNGFFSPNNEEYKVHEVITYSCQKDYELNGSKLSTCTENGFNPAPPTCVSVQCVNPAITNGQPVSGSRPPYKFGSSVNLRCNKGHNMDGSPTVTCDINSEWIPALPACTPIECKAPVLVNGMVDDHRTSFKYEDTVTLKCNSGYDLRGPSSLTCGESNKWKENLPECVKANNNGHVVKTVLAILGSVVGALLIGVCVYCGILKKKKGKFDRPVAPA